VLFNSRKNILGIDIGYESVKIVSLSFSGTKISSLRATEIPIKERLFSKEKFTNLAEAANLIKEGCRKADIKITPSTKVITTLPESFVFSKTLQLSKMPKNQLAKAVYNQASDQLPIPLEKAYFDFQVLVDHPNEALMDIMIVAAPKVLVDDYVELSKILGIDLLALETKPIAAGRAILSQERKDKGILICEIGTELSRISIWDNKSIRVATTVAIGKANLFEAMGGNDSKSPQINSANETNVLVPLTGIIDEILNIIKYHKNRDYNPSDITKIFICGSGGKIAGLDKLFKNELKIETEFFKFNYAQKSQIGPEFTVALGCALRSGSEDL